MKSVLCGVLVGVLTASSVYAQASAQTQRQNPDLSWSGVALAGLGGGILGWGLGPTHGPSAPCISY